jgi:hypothetical protein
MKSFAQLRKDPIIVLGGMIVMLTLVVGAGFFFLYFKSELDVKQVGNEVGIIRSMFSQKSRLEANKAGSSSDYKVLATGAYGSLQLIGHGTCSGDYSIADAGFDEDGDQLYSLGYREEVSIPHIDDLGMVTIEPGGRMGFIKETHLTSLGNLRECQVGVMLYQPE